MSKLTRGITMKFYNEEFLLPFWLKHHVKMFDTGKLINWHSTDNSVDICKELAPDWEIITPKGKTFSTVNGDEESKKAEIRLGNMWKCTLNVTEFLVTPNLDTLIQVAGDSKYRAIYPARAVALVDRPESIGREIDPDKSLILQCSEGIILPSHTRRERSVRIKDHVYDGISVDRNSRWSCLHHRIMHNLDHGRYTKGHHHSKIQKVIASNQMWIVWFLYSPYEQLRERIIQWSDRKPESDLKRGWGTHHFRTPAQVDARFKDLSWRMEDVFRNREYKDILLRWSKKYG